jgi:diaminopimelate epimerase
MWRPAENIPFSKLSGTGNDFIIIDNRDGAVPEHAMPEFVSRICRRAVSVGADGAIFIQNHPELDFAWRFFNSDGSEGEMCGNGSRCAARFAYSRGIAGREMKFLTMAGVIEAFVTGETTVKVRLTGARGYRKFSIELDGARTVSGDFINTGVPHAVIRADDLEKLDVKKLGREIRYAGEFAPAGTNANFVKVAGKHELLIRTYERGVEDETLACGTGCVAAAVTMAQNGLVESPVSLKVRSGEIVKVEFSGGNPAGGPLWLEGPVRWVYDGILRPEAVLGDMNAGL